MGSIYQNPAQTLLFKVRQTHCLPQHPPTPLVPDHLVSSAGLRYGVKPHYPHPAPYRPLPPTLRGNYSLNMDEGSEGFK